MAEYQKVSVPQIERHVVCKKDLYDACLRNGYYLPAYKSKIVTEEYLLAVANNKLWCPLYKDIRLLPCPHPPARNILLQKVLTTLQQMNRQSGIDEIHVPDKKWLLSILSTFGPKDEIFAKDYHPPPKGAKQNLYRTVELPPAFIAGLPETKSKVKSRRLGVLSTGKQTLRYMRLREQRNKFEKLLEQEKIAMEASKQKRHQVAIGKEQQQIIIQQSPAKGQSSNQMAPQ